MVEKILIVEDELEMLQFLERYYSRKAYKITAVDSTEKAWAALCETEYDLVISDMAFDGMSGIDLLKMIREVDKDLPFIIITGQGSIESAVEAIKIGAFHYVTKPFKPRELEIIASRAIEFGKIHKKFERIHREEAERESQSVVFGNNRQIKQVMQVIDKISSSQAPIIIEGETGTGKSVFAHHIHQISDRSNGPFVTIDCGALSENLLESELFGHVKGAFTGAVRAKRGLFEDAHGGTVFLDEIGEMTLSTQVKLLRALQEFEIKPVGGNQSIKIDVRVVSATNQDLQEKISNGSFREDLYYRLAVIPLYLPPLRQRPEDILLFVGHFVQKFNKQHNKKIVKIEPRVLQAFKESPWKGNIRELKNVVERAVLLSESNVITYDCLNPTSYQSVATKIGISEEPVSLKEALEITEKKAIQTALDIANENRSKAADILGIGRRTLYSKMAYYHIE
ncbi:MAG: sigma-54 dependent transcriptional regulator [Proteobacteria bacterium]|nr:sigma-54 dependent transcriptional regulator [Pseudomonadota bacterium]MBU1697713.1 sigma-54 dependent transcriptional regulator [Pseudomonadota bacterium]